MKGDGGFDHYSTLIIGDTLERRSRLAIWKSCAHATLVFLTVIPVEDRLLSCKPTEDGVFPPTYAPLPCPSTQDSLLVPS
jgi:hypothetical protein